VRVAIGGKGDLPRLDLNHSEHDGGNGPSVVRGTRTRVAALPAVSVVVLNFNGAKIIGRCLEHLIAQTFDDFEIVVIDNGSTDGSVAAMEPYLGSRRLSIVRVPRNLGVAAGRNLGAAHARGSIVAFVDNDGYADPRWLSEIVRVFALDQAVGAVGSLVFFDRNKLVLNSAGGTVNLQGYGVDRCFNAPYEFAQVPHEILYPMGCGMAIRGEVLRKIGPLDRHLLNYYDDFELGVRVWQAGYKVVLAPNAWIDHGFGSADQVLGNKAALCERNRVRTVLKYFPIGHLPRWASRELSMWRATEPRWRALALRAYLWNVRRLGSALLLRMRSAGRAAAFWHLVEPSWGRFPPSITESHARADLRAAGAELICDGEQDAAQLLYGWWPAQVEEGLHYRWSGAQAAALFRFHRPVYGCAARLLSASPARQARVMIRPLGKLEPAVRLQFVAEPGWHTWELRCRLAAGSYELVLVTEPAHIDAWGRTVGVAVAWLRFE
jgi:GT2 family glycosyltransferase